MPELLAATQLVDVERRGPDLGLGEAFVPVRHHTVTGVDDGFLQGCEIAAIEPDRVRQVRRAWVRSPVPSSMWQEAQLSSKTTAPASTSEASCGSPEATSRS